MSEPSIADMIQSNFEKVFAKWGVDEFDFKYAIEKEFL
jgi:hypothetical protein